jgi:Fe-S-cluster containining protein
MESAIKENILLTIFNEFEKWSSSIPHVCVEGCSTCCTQNVMITALEGERILQFIRQKNLQQWCADRLQRSRKTPAPAQTTNEYAAACLQQLEVKDDGTAVDRGASCPFLENHRCIIYPVRPFSCRCFLSEKPCGTEQIAIQPPSYVAAATAMLQLIEHLGQNEYWGFMPDVLLALLDALKFKEIASEVRDNSLVIQARLRTRTARPLPGFMLLDDEWEALSPLFENIFATRIGSLTIHDILNGKTPVP